ncbi:MAG TPA: pyruvate kinase, partial [Chthoniobacterales bacterium]
ISVGDVVLVDNGVMRLLVLNKKRNRIRCKVLTPGVLGSRRHINLPGVRVNLPPLTEKDLEDVALGAKVKVDFVALSFARKKSDLQELRRVLKKAKSRAQVVAKIEDQSAVRHIGQMIEAADVVMIARGDLGIECPMEELPIIQRKIVKQCLRIGKPVIVATHMLESMIENPVPTRAEITDVANAVFEQADAIMLSGETSTGRYPVECVKVFDRVARRIERSGGAGYGKDAILEDARQKTCASAVVLANSLPRAKLVVFTHHGTMAGYVSNLRPENAPIFAFTPSEPVFRQIVILWGTHPIMLEFADDPHVTIESAIKYLRQQKLTEPGDNLIVLSDMLGGRDKVDSVQLRTAE